MKIRTLIVAAAALLMTACGTTNREHFFAAYADNNVMVIVVAETDGIKQRVVHRDPDNFPAYRVITGPVRSMRMLLEAQGLTVDE